MNGRDPLISVVIPVYNVETYLGQTIQSVLRQAIGFKDNIEVILVNDGSTDSSESICLDFKSKYPENITYITQSNEGVSNARNKGLTQAKGTYVHFLDGDDCISANFYEESVKFLRSYADEVDFVASKILFFDQVYQASYLVDNFKQTRVLDLDIEPEKSIFHVASTLIMRQSIEGMSFDEGLRYAEDTKFLNQLLHKKRKYGVLSKSSYYYRKRADQNSAINGKLSDKAHYLTTPQRVFGELVSLWGSAPYIQHLTINEIAWRLREEKQQTVLSDDEERSYKQTIYELASGINQEVILQNKLLSLEQKIFLLNKKGENFQEGLNWKDGRYTVGGNQLFDPATQAGVTLDFIHDIGEGKYRIEGFTRTNLIVPGDEYALVTSKGTFPMTTVPRSQIQETFLGDTVTASKAFEVVIEYDVVDTIKAVYRTNERSTQIRIETKQFTGLGPVNKAYKRKQSSILQKNGSTITIFPDTRGKVIKAEIGFSLRILCNINLRRALNWQKKNIVNMKTMYFFMKKRDLFFELVGPLALILRSLYIGMIDIAVRQLYFAGVYRSAKPTWLISDRGSAAGDNGEALFRHICEKEKSEADVFFVVSRKSSDYERLKKIGNVLAIESLKYRLLFLRSNKVISSAADYYVYNPFGYRWTHLNDLYDFDFVFLQHGITKDDMSGWLNRFEKNIRLFITASPREYQSILDYDYYYPKDNVLLTGFPRFDLLTNDPKNKLMLAPTWRHNLLDETRHSTDGIRKHSDTFADTEYFHFYNNFMNDSRVIAALKSSGMVGEFYLHPAFSRQADDFAKNALFVIKKMPYDYKTAFAESNLLVTDYSSVAFDFAYLKKPVVYTQFDKDSVYEDHIYQAGYFSYEDDGFGPVVYDYEKAVDEVVKLIARKASSMAPEYEQRVDKFFYKNDRENSQRVYEAIKAIN